MVEGKLKHVGIHIVVQLIIAALQGMNSSRGVLMVYAPLVMTEVLRCGILWMKNRKIGLKDLKIFSFCMGICIVSYGMTYLPWSVKKEVSVDISNVSDKIIQLILPRLLSWLGITGNANIFLRLIIIAAVILSCVMGIVCLLRLCKMEKCDLALVFFWCSFLLTTVMLIMTDTGEVSGRYFLQAYFIIYLSVIYVVQVLDIGKMWKMLGIGVIMVYAVVNMECNFKYLIHVENVRGAK